jgi:hypothetical protein
MGDRIAGWQAGARRLSRGSPSFIPFPGGRGGGQQAAGWASLPPGLRLTELLIGCPCPAHLPGHPRKGRVCVRRARGWPKGQEGPWPVLVSKAAEAPRLSCGRFSGLAPGAFKMPGGDWGTVHRFPGPCGFQRKPLLLWWASALSELDQAPCWHYLP